MPAELEPSHLALLLSRVPGLGPRGTYRILTRPGPDILTASAYDLKKSYKLTAPAAEYIVENAQALRAESAELLEKARSLGIHVITVFDNSYPTSLKAYHLRLPPVIYAYGNLRLLQERRFAVVSSSTLSHRGSDATTEIAGILIDEGLTVVTSHNNAPYQLSLLAAKRRKAPSVVALDRGIISAFHGLLDWQPVAAARIWDPQFDLERDLVISQFRLGDHWIGENSRLRDRMVFGLADVVIAVEIRAGGVMEKECLSARDRGRELLVCSFESDNPPGNESLFRADCQKLDPRETRSQLISHCVAPLFEGRSDDRSEEEE